MKSPLAGSSCNPDRPRHLRLASKSNAVASKNQVFCQVSTTQPIVFDVGQATLEVLMDTNWRIHPEGVAAVGKWHARIDKETVAWSPNITAIAADNIPDRNAVNPRSQA